MAQKKFAVIGAGQFGQAISLALSEKGFEVLVIDKDMKKVQYISDDVAYAVCTDATDKRALLNENIKDFDAVIVAIGDDFVERLLCISNLIDLGIEKIFCRTKGKHQQTILEKMGITEFLSRKTSWPPCWLNVSATPTSFPTCNSLTSTELRPSSLPTDSKDSPSAMSTSVTTTT